MAIGSTLPPQAYTREILAVAFNWLQTQPDSIRRLASTPDALVGLYLRAQRYSQTTAEGDAPISSQNFISDLKNLAEGLKQFEDEPARPTADHRQAAPLAPTSQYVPTTMQSQATTHAPPAVHSHAAQHASPVAPPAPTAAATARPVPPPPAPATSVPPLPNRIATHAPAVGTSYQQSALGHQVPPPTSAPPAAPAANAAAPIASEFDLRRLHPQSQQMIQEVKRAFNMQSDQEVVNMLVAIAYKNLGSLLR